MRTVAPINCPGKLYAVAIHMSQWGSPVCIEYSDYPWHLTCIPMHLQLCPQAMRDM
jgi:hypothetical protein